MAQGQGSHVLVVGAGSMGLITGYILQLAGAKITFLIRPHRAESLDRPQKLYSYDDNQLKTFTGYDYITNPSDISGTDYDFIIITLDGAALKNEVGETLVKSLGKAVRGTRAKIILGTVFFNLMPWFLKTANLESEQVISGQLWIHIYPTSAVTLPVHGSEDVKLIAQADQAYTDCLGQGFSVENSSPAIATAFADLWNSSGVSKCGVVPKEESAVNMTSFFPILAVWGLLDWRNAQKFDATDPLWILAVKAVKEIQGLGLHGAVGQQAAAATTEASLVQVFAGMDKVMPLNLEEFNRYHHGGKVNTQDRALLHACIEQGDAEGKSMTALKDLVRRIEAQAPRE
ncbi:hypothetical protein LTR84_008063 [Exophiala bonariae]|uniref:Ketopantoate reductase N-terminal domain-containing protein n=1 Tax=Exophiala bonariae TaxID=1690606 RepID=A0AAV9NQE2_9EURO|nr:hypothetical protein LTR84_008063 [Exophiala bonariae]